MNKTKVNILPCYKDAFASDKRFLYLYGGASSGKSYFAAQKLVLRMLGEKGHTFLVMRKFKEDIMPSVYEELKRAIDGMGLTELFYFTVSPMRIYCNVTGGKFIFRGADDPEKLKSIKGITGVWMEEASQFNHDDFKQVNLRLRDECAFYKQIILTFNPVDVTNWLYQVWVLNNQYADQCLKVHTTYKDNRYLAEDAKAAIDSYQTTDPEYYKVYGLGEWGSLGRLVIGNLPTFTEYPTKITEVFYGLDFGYNVPTSLVRVSYTDGCYYVQELIYESMLTTASIIDKMRALGIGKNETVYCDSAEPDKIDELFYAGFFTRKANKDVKAGLDYIRSKRKSVYSHASNHNLNAELIGYSYKKDKNGNYVDEVVKHNDHATDAMRYAIFTHYREVLTGGLQL